MTRYAEEKAYVWEHFATIVESTNPRTISREHFDYAMDMLIDRVERAVEAKYNSGERTPWTKGVEAEFLKDVAGPAATAFQSLPYEPLSPAMVELNERKTHFTAQEYWAYDTFQGRVEGPNSGYKIIDAGIGRVMAWNSMGSLTGLQIQMLPMNIRDVVVRTWRQDANSDRWINPAAVPVAS